MNIIDNSHSHNQSPLNQQQLENKVENSQVPLKMNRPLHDGRVKFLAQNAIKYIEQLNKDLKIDPDRVELIFMDPENSIHEAHTLYDTMVSHIETSEYIQSNQLCPGSFFNPELNICEHVLKQYLSLDELHKNLNCYLRTGYIKSAFPEQKITRENAQRFKSETAFLAFCVQLYLVKHQTAPEVKSYKSNFDFPRTYRGTVTRGVTIADAKEAEEYKSYELENATQFLSTSSKIGSAVFFGNIEKVYTPGGIAGIIPPGKLVQFTHECEVLFPIHSKLLCR